MIGSRGDQDNTAAPKIEIASLGKTYAGASGLITALEKLQLRVNEGEFICIVGPSGCGKTTLLRILAGLEQPSSGEARIARHDPGRPLTAMVFQENSIFPWMRVRDNVGYGLDLRGVGRSERDRVVSHFVAMSGLALFADAWPHQLSGGMKQRVSVARAFANDPEILLMDEPFAALDEQTKIVLQQELLRIWAETRKTVLFITHSIDEALVLADRIVVMAGRPGRIVADLAIDFPRPRLVHQLKSDPQFGDMWRRIWTMLDDARTHGITPA